MYKIGVSGFPGAGVNTFFVNLVEGLANRKVKWEKLGIYLFKSPKLADLCFTKPTNVEEIKTDVDLMINVVSCKNESKLNNTFLIGKSNAFVVNFAPRGKDLSSELVMYCNSLIARTDRLTCYRLKGRLSELDEFKSVAEKGESLFKAGESVGASEMNTVIEEIVAQFLMPAGAV